MYVFTLGREHWKRDMRITKILWAAVPAVFLIAIALAVLGPGPEREPKVRLRQIVIKSDISNREDIERARQEIEEIYEFLETGADFEQLALTKSEGPNNATGGNMGWIGMGILPKHLEDAAFQLEAGQYSEIIEGRVGDEMIYRIFLVEERRNF